VSAWHKSTAAPRFKAYYRNSSGGWQFWAQSALLPTRDTYGYSEWVTPPAPAGALGLSVGLSLEQVGTLTLDDFTLADLGEGPVPAVDRQASVN